MRKVAMRKIQEAPAPLGIRHGDMVKVMAGRSKGKTGKVLTVDPVKRRVTVEHANIIKKHTRPNPSKNVRGRNSREGRPDSRVQRDAGLPWMREAHARRAHHAARRHEDAGLPPLQHDI